MIPIHLVSEWGSLCFPRNHYHLGQNYEPWALQAKLEINSVSMTLWRDRMRSGNPGGSLRWVKPGWIGVQRRMPFRVKRSQLYYYPVLRLLGVIHIYIYIWVGYKSCEITLVARALALRALGTHVLQLTCCNLCQCIFHGQKYVIGFFWVRGMSMFFLVNQKCIGILAKIK